MLTKHITIRDFELDDAVDVAMLLQDLTLFMPTNIKNNDFASAFYHNEYAIGIVAECDNTIIGFCSMFILPRIRGGSSAIIEDMIIKSDFRGQGIGGRILDKLIMLAQSRGCFKICLETSIDAQALYASREFHLGAKTAKKFL